MNEIAEIRPSPIAGTWYYGNPDRLRQQVDQFLAAARLPALEGQVVALIAPHAGHRYSGRTAGHAFASVLGQERDLVAVISPMHAPYPANLITTAHRAYATPLGEVWVDAKALADMEDHLSQLYVTCGASVSQGATIAAMGSTGRSSGPHLHFELMNASGVRVNPWDFLIK